MKNLFNSVKVFKPNKNVFDLTHDVKMSMNMGELIPVMLTHCVPGDKFKIGCESLVRFAPMVAPMMHRVDVTVHYFFVPNRILWDNWENFITNTKVGGAIPAAPVVAYSSYNRLADYLGLPDPHDGNSEAVSAFPFAAYLKIWNEYYRDQNLQTDEDINTQLSDGFNGNLNAGAINLSRLKNRCWEHDYFTACLPFAQKGDAVEIPISADVSFKDPADLVNDVVYDNNGGVWGLADGDVIGTTGTLQVDDGIVKRDATIDNSANLEVLNADTTINDLRRAYRLQEFLEKLARGGSRYFETIKSMFGLTSPDKRLQRPEYITGVKTPVMIGEVLQTGETNTTPQGNMAGHGAAVVSGQYGHYFCEEHGMIIGIMSVMPKTAYQQGISRHWTKSDPLDYFFPDFANIGEQSVANREVYAFQGAAGDETFGYVPRYAEYKFENNRVAGDFKTTLDFWHMGRIFGSAPALNEDFVKSDPTARIFAVTDPDVQHLWCHVLNKVTAVRPMPKFGTPTF